MSVRVTVPNAKFNTITLNIHSDQQNVQQAKENKITVHEPPHECLQPIDILR